MKYKLNDYFIGLKTALLISLFFFIATSFKENIADWNKVLKVSLGYGISIYSSIWLAYGILETINTYRENKNGREILLGPKEYFITSFFGLVIGSFIGQWLKSIILVTDINFGQIPLIIIIGSFISLMFIYKYQFQINETEKNELRLINEKIQSMKHLDFLKTLNVSVGKSQKIIPINEVIFFKSIDHYTHVYIENGEFITDYSIKKLNEKLNPREFIQIHRNCIVSLNSIHSIEHGSQWIVKTKSGEKLKVSRNSRNKLKDSFS